MTKPNHLSLSQFSRPSRKLVLQCPRCKELTSLREFATTDEGIAIRCPECADVFFYPSSLTAEALGAASETSLPKALTSESLSVAQQRASLEGREEGEETPGEEDAAELVIPEGMRQCPKCLNLCRDFLDNCPSCGLAFANIGVTFVPQSAETASSPQERGAWNLWEDTLAHWDDPYQHERFLQYCVSHELFDFVSTRYREARHRGGKFASTAQAQLGKIVDLVQQHFALYQERNVPASRKIGTWKMALTVFLLLFGLVAFYIIWRQAFAPSQVIIP